MPRFRHSYDDEVRRFRPHFYEEGFVNDRHAGLVESLKDVRGKLEEGDHLKLYEAAYYAQGPIVEVGRLAGKSTVILALGSLDGSGQPIYSIEYDNRHLELAQEHLRQFGMLDRVTLIQGDSAVQLARLPGPLDTVFVDGDHSYEGVKRDVAALDGLVATGGVVMFHDYYHPANDTGEYGVARAVGEARAAWSFRGRSGGIAVFEQM